MSDVTDIVVVHSLADEFMPEVNKQLAKKLNDPTVPPYGDFIEMPYNPPDGKALQTSVWAKAFNYLTEEDRSVVISTIFEEFNKANIEDSIPEEPFEISDKPPFVLVQLEDDMGSTIHCKPPTPPEELQ